MGLLDDIPGKEGRPVAAGQPYFISDGSPINTFEFIRPLLRGLDYDLPKSWLSVSHALSMAKIFWAVYSMLYPLLNRRWLPQPFILPAEVHKVGVTHYFSILKARNELGYVPMVSPREGMAATMATIACWQDRKNKSLDGPPIYVWGLIVIGMFALFACGWLPPIGPVPLLRSIGFFLFRSMFGIRLAFVIATALHIGEGLYAWRVAKRVDPVNARGWFWQTFVLGFPSLRLLLKRAKKVV